MRIRPFVFDPSGGSYIALISEALSFNPRSSGHGAGEPVQESKPRRGLLEKIDQWFWRLRQRDHEEYLAQAKDVVDLERRMREIERSVGSRYF